MMIPTTRPFKKLDQRGAAMLEMALAVPVFVALLLALVDFGMYFTTRSVLQSAAYNGAKMACSNKAEVANTVNETVGAVIAANRITITGPTALGAAPLTRQRVQLSCTGAAISPFTSALSLYPITTTGLAKCP